MTHNNKAPFGRLGAREEGGTVYRVKVKQRQGSPSQLSATSHLLVKQGPDLIDLRLVIGKGRNFGLTNMAFLGLMVFDL